ncbi:NTP transferase domain-containing protein [Candidatus Beckwithbacteria bacterium]|nr:NTP transferase domain-containing protein [Candidatus Beckwithbacteria bacterium]
MKNYQNVAAVVLAAGKGTRIKNKKDGVNKVVLRLNGKPMIQYTVEKIEKLGLEQIILVVGYARQSIIKLFDNRVDYAIQEPQLGTGHAIECALPKIKENIKYILVLNADDSAFYSISLLKDLIDKELKNESAFSFLTLKKDDPTGLGRIKRDSKGFPKKIIEEKSATEEEKRIKEINLGAYCFSKKFLEECLSKVELDPLKKEKYITSLVEIAYKNREKTSVICIKDESLWFGVNTDEQLEEANLRMQHN